MSWKFWRHDRAPRLEVDDTWYGYRYAGIRTTPNGNTHVRITAYVVPYTTMVASIPWNQRQGLFIPMDDERTARYSFATKVPENVHGYGAANLFAAAPFSTPISRGRRAGVIEREYTAGNDYQIDREVQRTATFSGVADFVSQDFMVTELMGPVYDRTQEQLGSTDKAITRMRHLLISAAKGLADGQGAARRRRLLRLQVHLLAPRRSSSQERTGGCSPLSKTPPSPKRSTRAGGTSMLKAEDNEILTRVGPGTLMGEPLRRYRTPAAFGRDPRAGQPARAGPAARRDRVAFRDTPGRSAWSRRTARTAARRSTTAATRAPPSAASTTAGRTTPTAPASTCRASRAPFCEKVWMRAYPTHESAGIVWAYLGLATR